MADLNDQNPERNKKAILGGVMGERVSRLLRAARILGGVSQKPALTRQGKEHVKEEAWKAIEPPLKKQLGERRVAPVIAPLGGMPSTLAKPTPVSGGEDGHPRLQQALPPDRRIAYNRRQNQQGLRRVNAAGRQSSETHRDAPASTPPEPPVPEASSSLIARAGTSGAGKGILIGLGATGATAGFVKFIDYLIS